MLIRDVLLQKDPEIAGIDVTADTLEALEILNGRHIGSLMVYDTGGDVAGILSERDILANFRESVKGIPVSRIMTPRERLIIAHTTDTVEYAMSMMTRHRIRHMPVFDGDSLIGLVSIGDVMKALSSHHEFETKMLEQYISGSQAIVS